MNAVVISANEHLIEELRKQPLFESVMQTEIAGEGGHSEVVIIDQEQVGINELLTYYKDREAEPSPKAAVFYLLANKEDTRIHSLFASKHITIVDADLNSNLLETVNFIVGRLQPETTSRNRNVITFFGADHSVGTTMMATACAEQLARMVHGRIGLFFMNEQPGTLYLKDRPGGGIGIDEIRMKLFNHILTRKELNEAYMDYKNLAVLRGPGNLLSNRHYHPEHAERLLTLASSDFDALIVDAGANIEYGLAVGALTSSQQNYLITTQQESSKSRFERIEQQVFKPLKLSSDQFFMVVNKYVKQPILTSGKDLANYHKMALAGTVPYLDLQGWQAEYEQKSLLHYEQDEYNESIERLSLLIARQVNVEVHKPQRKPTFLNKLFGGAKGGS